VRIGKAGAVFGKMKKVWKNTNISLKVKTRLYEALVLSTLLHSAELWPLSATLTKNLMLRTTYGKEVYWVSHGRTR